jgi:two-component system, NarL family, sensor histidine kinase UhpB
MTAPPSTDDREAPGGPVIPLFWRLFVPNACVLVVACVVLILEPANGRVPALVGGLTIMLVTNLLLMRRAFTPLMNLTIAMHRIDPLRPGGRVRVAGPPSEVTVLTNAFNAMLDRIETERRESARRTAAAEDSERRHVAAELHDEIGQTLTALVLQLSRIRSSGGADADELAEAEATAEAALDGVRRLARRMRPEALDELGLGGALTILCNRITRQTGLAVRRRLPEEPPRLSLDAQLAVYRIAQESLTNVVRHASASEARLRLVPGSEHVELTVADDGVGMPPGAIESEGGVRGMRERALLIGAELAWLPSPGGGTTVRLAVPLDAARSDADAEPA